MDFRRITAVVTPAPNQDLISLQDARDELGTKRADDARLRRYIAESSAAIATYTRRVWRQETVTETFYFGGYNWGGGYNGWDWGNRYHAHGGPIALVLSRFPVASIDGVTIPDGTPLDPTGYVLDAAKGLLYRADDCSVYDAWGGNLSVTYTGGYKDVDDVPADVRQGCMTLVRHRAASFSRDPYLRSINVPGVQEETYWVGQIGESGSMPPETAGLLSGHIDMRSA
jgi:hypothetical protein